jgi:hypothetical protein
MGLINHYAAVKRKAALVAELKEKIRLNNLKAKT